jgi:hypothetical protein
VIGIPCIDLEEPAVSPSGIASRLIRYKKEEYDERSDSLGEKGVDNAIVKGYSFGIDRVIDSAQGNNSCPR